MNDREGSGGGEPSSGQRDGAFDRLLRPVKEIFLAPVLVALTAVDYVLVGCLLWQRRITPPLAGSLVVFSLVAWWFAAWFYPFFEKSHARGPHRARFPIAVSQGLKWFAWLCLFVVHLTLGMIGVFGLR